MRDGLAVTARFWFRSGWTGDRLYFDLDLVIGRDGSFKDLTPGDYSGIWPPFSAAIVTAAVLDDLNRSTGSGSSYSGGSSYTPRPAASAPSTYTSPFSVEAVPLGEWRYGYALKRAQADLDAGKREILAHAAAVVKVTDTYAYVIGPDGVVLPDVSGSGVVAYTTIEQPELQRLVGIYSFPTAAQRAALAAVQDCRARRRSFPC